MTDAPPHLSSGTIDALKNIEYVLRKDSLTDNERVESARIGINRLLATLSPQAQAGETRPFYGAECPSYPACEGGCGLGCTKEIERSRHSAQPPATRDALAQTLLDEDYQDCDSHELADAVLKHWDVRWKGASPPAALPTDRYAVDDPWSRPPSPDEPRDALGQTASEVYSPEFAPPTLREALEDLLKDIDESQALGMPVLLRRDTIAEARAALALSSTGRDTP